MKRRNFFGSLFAAGAVLKSETLIGNPAPKGSGEVVTPVTVSGQIVLSGSDIKYTLERIKVRSIPTHAKISPELLK